MIAAIVLSIAGLVLACWLLFTLAVYALSFAVAVSAGLFAHQTGAGFLGSILVGLVAGALSLIAGRAVFMSVRSPVVRASVALLFAAPAVLAGYSAVHGLTAFSGASNLWQQALSIIGGIIVGCVAFSRLAMFQAVEADAGGSPTLRSPIVASAANDG